MISSTYIKPAGVKSMERAGIVQLVRVSKLRGYVSKRKHPDGIVWVYSGRHGEGYCIDFHLPGKNYFQREYYIKN